MIKITLIFVIQNDPEVRFIEMTSVIRLRCVPRDRLEREAKQVRVKTFYATEEGRRESI